jgi:HEPN domain-containing protein
VEKAEEDHRAAKYLLASDRRFNGVVCFHCQQAAEKYLKALLEELNIYVEKTHDLKKLHKQLLPYHPPLRPLRRGIGILNRYSVAVRYPGKRTTKRQSQAGLRWADKVRDACRGLLGL